MSLRGDGERSGRICDETIEGLKCVSDGDSG